MKELVKYPNFVVWKDGKVPFNPNTNGNTIANVNDSRTWATYDIAKNLANTDSTVNGIGFVLAGNTPLIGFDLDGCIQDDKQLSTDAARIVAELDTYTEISPSGKGIRMFLFCSKQDPLLQELTNKSRDFDFKSFEVYWDHRYLTITENSYHSKPKAIRQVHDLNVISFLKDFKKSEIRMSSSDTAPTYKKESEELIHKLRMDNEAILFELLFDKGDISIKGGDHSAADFKLCTILAKQAGYNPSLIDYVFRLSRLYREKWDKKHYKDGSTYGQVTIEKAIKHVGLKLKTRKEVISYLRFLYDFRFNTILQMVEWKYKTDKSFTRMDDRDFHNILNKLKDNGSSMNESTLDSLLKSDFSPNFDPFEHYFNQLPIWDGKIDYIKALATTLKTDNQQLWEVALRRWLIAAVATALSDKINHAMIVLTGGQGLGKTSWLSKLMPKAIDSIHYHSGYFNPEDKDHRRYLTECLLVNLDELQWFGSKNETLKSILTEKELKFRRAYARKDTLALRRASFMASTNSDEFLTDSSGSRRFLVFTAEQIDYMHTINIDMVWAQAFALFKKGERFYFDRTEQQLFEKHNQKYQKGTLESELIEKYLTIHTKPIANRSHKDRFTATEICSLIFNMEEIPPKFNSRDNITEYLKQRGCYSTISANTRKWEVERKGFETQSI